jgi:HEAT repeat protein
MLKDCPKCGKTVATDHEACEFCNVNIGFHEENMRLAEEGKKLEHGSNYEGAKAFYEKIKDPKTPEISQLLEQVSRKLELIDDSRTRANEFIKAKKWKKARQCFIEIQKLEPSNDFATTGLRSIRTHSKRNLRVACMVVCAIIFVTVGLGFCTRMNNVHYLATKGLRSLLDSEDLAVKNSAALVLGWQGDHVAAPTLRVLANSGDPKKSIYSSAALLGIDPSAAIPVLKGIMREGDVALTLGAAYTLTELGDTSIVPELASYLDMPDEDLRIGASVLLFDFGYSLGIPVVQEALTDTLQSSKLKGLYALYVLGDKKILAFHEDNWAPAVKNLLWDTSAEVRLLAAFLLNEFSSNLSSQDSISIEQILWEGFAHKDKSIPEAEEIPDIWAFHIAKRIINRRGDEDISGSAHAVKEIRQKCNNALSRVELGDETIMAELLAALSSEDKQKQLYASIALLKAGDKKSVPVLKELLKEKDDVLKLSACKLIVEFI